jgi:hypothetical protein
MVGEMMQKSAQAKILEFYLAQEPFGTSPPFTFKYVTRTWPKPDFLLS